MLTFAGIVVAVPIVFWGTTRLLTAPLLLHAPRLSLSSIYSYEVGQPGRVAEQGDLYVVVWWKVRAHRHSCATWLLETILTRSLFS